MGSSMQARSHGVAGNTLIRAERDVQLSAKIVRGSEIWIWVTTGDRAWKLQDEMVTSRPSQLPIEMQTLWQEVFWIMKNGDAITAPPLVEAATREEN